MNNEEDFEDDDDLEYRLVPSRPFSLWALVSFVLNLIMGIARGVLVATDQLNDEIIGAQGFSVQKKEFGDAARMEIEAIPVTEEPS